MVSCYICLDGPVAKGPLYLSNCGCVVGWFHEDCHERWIRAQNSMIPRCGMCRQSFEMKINYSFSFWAGTDQQNLWLTGAILTLEFIQAAVIGTQAAFWVPGESFFVLVIPFLTYPISTYDFYCGHIIFKSLSFQLLHLSIISSQAVQLKMILAAIHGLVFYLVHLIQCQREWHPLGALGGRPAFDLLFPYAISREIRYVRCLRIPQPAPGT